MCLLDVYGSSVIFIHLDSEAATCCAAGCVSSQSNSSRRILGDFEWSGGSPNKERNTFTSELPDQSADML